MKGIFLEELGELQLRMIDGGGISEVAEDLLLIGGGASAAGSGSALTYAAATATGKMVTVLGVEVAKGLAAATGAWR